MPRHDYDNYRGESSRGDRRSFGKDIKRGIERFFGDDDSGMMEEHRTGRGRERSMTGRSLGQDNRRMQRGMGYQDDYDSGMRSDFGRGRGLFGEGADFNRKREYSSSDRGFFGKGPKGWKRSDERIKEEVCEALYRDQYVDASDIEIIVNDGVVRLTGTVDSRQTKRAAEECVEDLSGVSDVRNELRVRRETDQSSLGSDIGQRQGQLDQGKRPLS